MGQHELCKVSGRTAVLKLMSNSGTCFGEFGQTTCPSLVCLLSWSCHFESQAAIATDVPYLQFFEATENSHSQHSDSGPKKLNLGLAPAPPTHSKPPPHLLGHGADTGPPTPFACFAFAARCWGAMNTVFSWYGLRDLDLDTTPSR